MWRSRKHRVVAVVAAWLMVLAVDLFVNAGLLVNTFTGDDPVLLPNTEAAKRIPVAYAAWAVQIAALQWLLTRLGIIRIASAASSGAAAGFVGGALPLVALWTIVRLEGALTATWLAAVIVEGAVAGAVLAYISRAGSRGRCGTRLHLQSGQPWPHCPGPALRGAGDRRLRSPERALGSGRAWPRGKGVADVRGVSPEDGSEIWRPIRWRARLPHIPA